MKEKKVDLLKQDTLIREYLQWLETKIVRTEGLPKNSDEKRPFLSVVMRTQGKRLSALQEVFLCLGGQTDMDFELLLIIHKAMRRNIEEVRRLVRKQPEELRERIRIFEVEYGKRSVPLNVGFAEAKGSYIAALDDDDLVFENWVEVFHCAAQQHFGRIIHTYSFAQDWTRIPEGKQAGALRAVYKPIPEYCTPFNLLDQIYANHCPFMTIAFPAFVFQEIDERFDEILDTTEDWDYIMRISALCGVYDVEEATSIYRIWKNEENSESLYSKDVWKKNQEYIWKKMEQQPLLIEKKYVSDLIEISKFRYFYQTSEKKVEVMRVNEWFQPKLYLDFGEGYNERDVLRSSDSGEEHTFRYCYKIKELSEKKVKSFRWDPSEKKDFVIQDLKITLRDQENVERKCKVNAGRTNGIRLERHTIVFLKEDPQICFKIKNNIHLKEIEISGKLEVKVTDEIYDKLLGESVLKKFMERLKWRLF